VLSSARRPPPAAAALWSQSGTPLTAPPPPLASPVRAAGSCGYTNRGPGDQPAALPFPRDQVAAAADANPDYAGSCGRCYLVRCVSDLVLRNDGSPIQLLPSADNRTLLQYDADPMRPYLPSIRRDVPDSRGRPFPGAAATAVRSARGDNRGAAVVAAPRCGRRRAGGRCRAASCSAASASDL